MLSVVIPALNEEQNIGACLEALTRQITKRHFEVIVVDNGSTDSTRRIAAGYDGRLQLRIINEARRGRGAARHRGFREAKGDIILSTDADAIVPPDWIEAFASAIENGKYVGATGIARIVDCSVWTNRMFNVCFPLLLRFNYVLYGHPGFSGYSFSIRRDAYFHAGEFDPNADAYEDLELAMRVSKLGKIALLSHPKIIFSGRRFQGGMFRACGEYLQTYFQKFIRKKKKVLLSNVK